MALSIGGLGSGIDTQGLVQQLLQAEALQQGKLKAAKGVVSVKSGAWGTLEKLVTALRERGTALQTPEKMRLTSVSSSQAGLATASSDPTAVPGSLTFRVERLATRQQVASTGFASTSSTVGAGTVAVGVGLAAVGATLSAGATGTTVKHAVEITVAADGTASAKVDGASVVFGTGANGEKTLAVGSATLSFAGAVMAGKATVGIAASSATTSVAGLAAEIAKTGGPATASAVDTGSGATPTQIVLSSGTTGKDGELSIAAHGVSGFASTTTLTAAQNAVLKVGDPATALTVEKSSNTITDLLPGVTLNLVKADSATDVTVTVRKDDDAVVKQVKSLSEQLNAVLGWITTNSKYDVASRKGGPMVGDGGVRALASQVRDAVQTTVSDGPYRTAVSVGLSANKTGTYDLDETKLREALKNDPEAVAKLVSAVADAVAKVAKSATEENGVVKTGQASTEARSKDLQSRIDAWDVRLLAIKKRYDRQFAALDTAMSRMNSQSSWLAGQIKSLPSGGD